MPAIVPEAGLRAVSASSTRHDARMTVRAGCMRGHILVGFPWNTLGYALTYPLPLMQSAAVLGIYGLTLVAVLIFALPPVLWSDAPARIAGRRLRAGALAVALLPLAAM